MPDDHSAGGTRPTILYVIPETPGVLADSHFFLKILILVKDLDDMPLSNAGLCVRTNRACSPLVDRWVSGGR